jgi:hypothetical protein
MNLISRKRTQKNAKERKEKKKRRKTERRLFHSLDDCCERKILTGRHEIMKYRKEDAGDWQ